MRGLTCRELVAVWERGRGRPAWYRALLPLTAVLGEAVERLADWPVGRRDGWLLAGRAWTFGATLEAVSQCPRPDCRMEVEVEVLTPRLLEAWPNDDAPGTVEVAEGGWSLTLRAPTSRDFAEAAGLSAAGLLRRCVVRAG